MRNLSEDEKIKFEVRFVAVNNIVPNKYRGQIGMQGIELIRDSLDLPNLDSGLIERDFAMVSYHCTATISIEEKTANKLYYKKGYFARTFKIDVKVFGSEKDNLPYVRTDVIVDRDDNGAIEKVSLKKMVDVGRLYQLWEDSNYEDEITTVDISL